MGHCDEKIAGALEILDGKWRPYILYQLFFNGTMRFSELQKALPNITKKMLASELRELEYHDIIERKVYGEIPPRVEYSVTDYGRKMFPLIEALAQWGMNHAEHLNELYGGERMMNPGDRDLRDDADAEPPRP